MMGLWRDTHRAAATRIATPRRSLPPFAYLGRVPFMDPVPHQSDILPFHLAHEPDHPSEETARGTGIEELIAQIKETADKLIRDHANRGDVKLLSTALRELRYSFKIF